MISDIIPPYKHVRFYTTSNAYSIEVYFACDDALVNAVYVYLAKEVPYLTYQGGEYFFDAETRKTHRMGSRLINLAKYKRLSLVNV